MSPAVVVVIGNAPFTVCIGGEGSSTEYGLPLTPSYGEVPPVWTFVHAN